MSSDGPKRYDAFLSYNAHDRAAVEALADRLRQRGLGLFLEVWELLPGRKFQPGLAQALIESRTCVVCLGPNGLGPWQMEEIEVAIDRRVRVADFHVIPVLLPGAERPRRGEVAHLEFLINASWVEFPRTLDDPCAFGSLVAGITGIKPEPPPEEVRRWEGRQPYRGLEAFGRDDRDFFFGRETLTNWLVSDLRREVRAPQGVRFLAVLGPSGSGKSSVVLAGLLPRLEEGAIDGSASWPAAVIRPGGDPLGNLAAEVVARFLPPGAVPDVGQALGLIDALERDEAGLDLFARMALRDAPAEGRLVVVVDQFEEVFTYEPKEGPAKERFARGRDAFFANLLRAAAAPDGRVAVVLTMRSDFLGPCAAFPRLNDVLNAHLVQVGPMRVPELRAAIERPAYRVGGEVEPALTERLLADVAGQAGALPLLQFALDQLWEKRPDRVLRLRAYEALGGVQGALEKRANEVLGRLTPEDRELCRRIFLRLVQPGEGTEDTKRRVSYRELLPADSTRAEAVRKLIHTLADRDARLITTEGSDATGGAVEVAHEALIRGWTQLRQWVDAERAGLRIQRRLTEAAREWKEHAGDVSLLYQGTRLAVAREWAEAHPKELNLGERAFLEASIQRAARERRRGRLLIAGLIAGLIAVVVVVSRLLVLDYQAEAARALEQVKNLCKANSLAVPDILRDVLDRPNAMARVRALWNDHTLGEWERVRLALALVDTDPVAPGFLYDHLGAAEPQELLLIRRVLGVHRAEFAPRFWKTLNAPGADDDTRIRAAVALADFDPDNPGWSAVAERVVRAVLADNPLNHKTWIEGLRPVRRHLLGPLTTAFHAKVPNERLFACTALSDYASEQPDRLCDLLKDADGRQFDILFPKVDGDKTRAVASMRDELSRTPPERAGEEVREGLARRQANAAIVLFRLGEVDPLWLSLRQGPDPRRRTYLIHRLAPYGIDPQSLIRRLPVEPIASARAAILMSLGEFPPGQLPDGLRRELAKQLLDLYTRDPDPGLHAAAGWLLTGWGFTDDLRAIDCSLAGSQPASGRYWFVNKEGQTFVVIPGPVTFLMGSPPGEPGRNSVEGPQHSRTIPRSFAVAAREVTVREFRRFLKDVGLQTDESFQANLRDFSPNDDGPILYVTWFQAAKYCRWLSDREGVKPDQMCYPEVKDIEPGMKLPKDYLTREGYRLPTEGEWEFACRSGTITPWEFGGEELLDRYARFLLNAKGPGTPHEQAWPTGQLKPNRFGLFDMHGNAYEWCLDRSYKYPYPVGEDREELDLVVADGTEDKNRRLFRGGSFTDFPSSLRSAYRDSANPASRPTFIGFRLARTCTRPLPPGPAPPDRDLPSPQEMKNQKSCWLTGPNRCSGVSPTGSSGTHQ